MTRSPRGTGSAEAWKVQGRLREGSEERGETSSLRTRLVDERVRDAEPLGQPAGKGPRSFAESSRAVETPSRSKEPGRELGVGDA